MSDEIRLHVHGRHGEIDVAALQRAVNGLVDFLRGAAPERWVVTDLRTGSLEAAVRPVEVDAETIAAQFHAIVAGINDLRDSPTPPQQWTDRMLSGIAEIAEVNLLHGVTGVDLRLGGSSPIAVTVETGAHARQALDTGPRSFGSVEGRVDRFLSRKSQRNFGLVDESEGHVVTVLFRRDDEETVRAAIGKRVVVWGVLRRTPEGRRKELTMEGLSQVDRSPTLTVDEVTGALGAAWTGGASSVEAIRRQRDGD